MAQAEIGIIGGSGLYAMPGLSKVKEVRLKTPFGSPSEAYVCGVLEGRKLPGAALDSKDVKIFQSASDRFRHFADEGGHSPLKTHRKMD